MRCTSNRVGAESAEAKGYLTVPCKAMISGEYAVLECGGSALALAEGTGLRVRVDSGSGVALRIPVLGVSQSWTEGEIRRGEEPDSGLLRCFWWAAKVVLAWAESPRIQASLKSVFSARSSGAEGSERVPGLEGVTFVVEALGGGNLPVGGSAALAVASVRGLALQLGVALEDGAVFRLAAAAHALAQRGGSAYDVAASAMGGWVLYERDADGPLPWEGWDPGVCGSQESLEATLAFGLEYGSWPRVRRRKRLSVGVLAGDTGVRALTAGYIARFACAKEREEVRAALRQHVEVSNALARAVWGGESASVIREAVRETVGTLRELDRVARLGIYTPEIETLLFEAARAGVTAKISGAGGGDCVVGLAWGREEYVRCQEAWERAGFRVIPLARPA